MPRVPPALHTRSEAYGGGIKDRQADGLATYSGTARRRAQTIRMSEACIRGWTVTAIGVKKALLQGLMHAELAKEAGDPPP